MSQLYIGDILDGSLGTIEFPLPENSFLVWREGIKLEAILCHSQSDLPPTWKNDQKFPWKIFGNFDLIKKSFPRFEIPTGSKVVDLASGAVLRLNANEGWIRFHGKRTKRIVIVDDSSTMRKLLKHVFSNFEGWEVVAEVEKAEDIPQTISEFYPDIITLDLNLGGVNGLYAMKNFIGPKKIPTLLITSQSKDDGNLVMDTLEAGALDYLQKPESGSWSLLAEELLLKMEAALKSKWQADQKTSSSKIVIKNNEFDPTKIIILIGSSTGGTQALQEIFTRLPKEIPPILVTQHIPAGFSKALADRLNGLCPFEIKEAEEGDEVRPGRVLIAPGDHHMQIASNGKTVEILNTEPVNRFRPSVDVMFGSATLSKKKVIAVMLTGMGKDGSQSMLELKKKGALTIAQDEKSCVVFGMPKEAIRLGAVDHIKSLDDIPECIIDLCRRSGS